MTDFKNNKIWFPFLILGNIFNLNDVNDLKF